MRVRLACVPAIRRFLSPALFMLVAGAHWVMPAAAQTSGRGASVRDVGKLEFEARCASCHGTNGKGYGPLTEWLRKSPPDLTLLARANGGVLPMERLYDSITGDKLVAAHGTRDMPVWGRVYRTDAAEYYMELPYDPEAHTRGRLLLLLEYINRLQQR